MFFTIIIFFILNIIFTFGQIKTEKARKNWLNDAREAYRKNEYISEYPESIFAQFSSDYKYDVMWRFNFSSWLILLICPFIFELKTFILIYLFNYMYSSHLRYFSIIEQKIDILKNKVYNEKEFETPIS